MKPGPPGSFGARLKAFREAAGYTQEELATIAGLSVHGVSALERGRAEGQGGRSRQSHADGYVLALWMSFSSESMEAMRPASYA